MKSLTLLQEFCFRGFYELQKLRINYILRKIIDLNYLKLRIPNFLSDVQ